MILCRSCGFRNPDSNDRCFRCQALLNLNHDEMKRAMKIGREKTGRWWPRLFVGGMLSRISRSRWFRQAMALPDDVPFRYPFTAGLLSIVPGLGHAYIGQRHKGVLLPAGWLLLFVLSLATLRQSYSNVILTTLALAWMAIWADAVSSAVRSNGGRMSFRHSLALICAAMFFTGTTLGLLQFFGMTFISFEKIMTDSMKPGLSLGDRVFVNRLSYFVRSPRVGEVAVYDPPVVTAERKGDLFRLNVQRYIQRIAGGPGDVVRKQGLAFTRNGRQLDREQLPFGADVLPDFEVTVPAGQYFVPVTYVPGDMLNALAGNPGLHYVGEPGFTFTNWPGCALVPESEIAGRVTALINPPERRRFF